MKLSKSLLVGTAVLLTMSSVTLSALTPDELANAIRTTRACPAASELENEPVVEQGWFSSFRAVTGNFLRTAGDAIRTEGDTKSTAGRVKEDIKDATLKAVSSKIGVALSGAKDAIFNAFGNGLRTLGQWIKGGEETQTTTRIILNNLGLSKYANSSDIEKGLRTAAAGLHLVNDKTSYEEYMKVVNACKNRAYASEAQLKAMDVNTVYVNVLATKALSGHNVPTYEAFAEGMKEQARDALKKIPEATKIDQYLQSIYKQITAEQAVNVKK